MQFVALLKCQHAGREQSDIAYPKILLSSKYIEPLYETIHMPYFKQYILA